MPKDWTKVDDMVKHMMLSCPNIFPSRKEALCHMFASYGTCLEWNEDGDLVYEAGWESGTPDRCELKEDKERDKDNPVFAFNTEATNLRR